jgi:hypothetical protein
LPITQAESGCPATLLIWCKLLPQDFLPPYEALLARNAAHSTRVSDKYIKYSVGLWERTYAALNLLWLGAAPALEQLMAADTVRCP